MLDGAGHRGQLKLCKWAVSGGGWGVGGGHVRNALKRYAGVLPCVRRQSIGGGLCACGGGHHRGVGGRHWDVGVWGSCELNHEKNKRMG